MKLAGTNSDKTRIEWISKELKSIPKGHRILDAGAGELRLKQYCDHLNYVSQDFCQYEGKGDGSALHGGAWNTSRIDIVSNIVSIPVPDKSFDAVLCSEVFEHIPDPILAVREFSRILKPGGILILSAPFCSLTHMAPYHFSGLNRYWYEVHLPNVGIDIDAITPNGNWFEFIGQELSRARWVSRTYSSSLLGWVMLIVGLQLRVALSFLSKFDRGSSELLCYGYMVRAHRTEYISCKDTVNPKNDYQK